MNSALPRLSPGAGPSRPVRVTTLGSAPLQVISVFSLVEVVLQAETTALKYSALLKRPGPQDEEEA